MNKTLRYQAALKALGYDPGPLDGVPGRKTLAALGAYDITTSKAARGADISAYQSKIDYKALASAVEFLIMRCSASLSPDKLFALHNDLAEKAGITARGAYHYFTPWQDPIKQAELVARKTLDSGLTIPIVADVETLAPKAKKGQPPPQPVSRLELIDRVGRFLDALKVLTGDNAILYTYAAFDIQHGLGRAFGDKHPLWIADYREGPPSFGRGWARVIGHQFKGDLGTVEGVTGPCDQNRLFIPLPDLLALK